MCLFNYKLYTYYCIAVSILMKSYASVYFYEHRSKIFVPDIADETSTSNFGFPLFVNKYSLLIGDIFFDGVGRILSCPLNNSKFEVKCETVGIEIKQDMKDFAVKNRAEIPSFCLGASIAADDNKLLTCAPLLPYEIHKKVTYGLCFEYDFESKKTENLNLASDANFILSTSWNVLLDKNNVFVADAALPSGGVHYKSLKNLQGWKEVDQKRDIYHLGRSIVSGNFFDKNGLYYAMSHDEGISFKSNLDVAAEEYDIFNEALCMFGETLTTVDFNFDSLDDLVVGAPAYSTEDSYEVGKIGIYYNLQEKDNTFLEIYGDRLLSRFGTAIAISSRMKQSFDIAVTAPYENSGSGALYIISGYELQGVTARRITLSSLKHTQKIQFDDLKTFGFSMKSLPNINHNDCKDLVIGSPDSAQASLVKCVPAVAFNISSRLEGNATTLSDDAQEVELEVCVNIKFPENPVVISNKFKIINDLSNDQDVFIKDPLFEINLSVMPRINHRCWKTIMYFKDHYSRRYDITSKIYYDAQSIISSRELENSVVGLMESGTNNYTLNFERKCLEDCEPNVGSIQLNSTTSIIFVGGTSKNEVSVSVLNTGHRTYDACVKVFTEGATIKESQQTCSLEVPKVYLCRLPMLEKMVDMRPLIIPLDIGYLNTNQTYIFLKVDLYENCTNKDIVKEYKNLTIPMTLYTDNIFVEGAKYDTTLSIDEESKEIENITNIFLYNIKNNGSIKWTNISAAMQFQVHKNSCVQLFQIMDSSNCSYKQTNDTATYFCNLNLKPNSIHKFIFGIIINNTKIKDNLISGKLVLQSRISLFLKPTDVIKTISMSATVSVEYSRKTVANDKTLMIVIGIVVGFLGLLVLVFILCKYKFFKREKKESLNNLKTEIIRKQSLAPAPIEMEVVDDCIFDDIDIDNYKSKDYECENHGNEVSDVNICSADEKLS